MSKETVNEGVQALAALVGTTQAELNKVDEAIVGESAALMPGAFTGHEILQGHINSVKGNNPTANPPGAPPASHTPPVHTPPVPAHGTPAHQAPPPPAPMPTYGGELTIILQKLVDIDGRITELTNRLNDIEYFDKKVVDSLSRGLKAKMKQVTIKFDDINHTQ